MDAVSRLREVYFLERLEPEEFQALADMMDLRPFVAGARILTQGEATTNFYIVDSGYVNLRLTDKFGYEKPIGSKGPGEYFGIKMFTTQEPAEFTFEAVNQAHMWVVERQDWDKLLEIFPNILEHMPELRAEYARLTRGLDWLSPGEIIDVLTRRHWWALLLMVRLPLLAALAFSAAFYVSMRFGVTENLPWVLYVYLAALGACLLWLSWNALNWFNDIYIVTNKRVVRINQVLFFSDSREELPIEKIQSQKIERGGPISVLLNIADLHLTSAASEEGGLTFEQVGNVERIQKAVDSERVHVTERKGASDRERIRNQIAKEIRHYVFKQPEPTEKPKAAPRPMTLGMRLRMIWLDAFGTETRREKVVTWRKHRIILLRQVLPFLAVFVVVGMLLIGFSIYGSALQLAENGVYAGLGLVLLVAFLGMVWQWMDWQVDEYCLTDSHIIDVESLPFGLRYNEQKADLAKIQDVNYARPRFLNTLLDYGNVISRVAGNADPFTFDDVAKPRIVADEISERIVILKLREAERATREQTRIVVDAIVAYHRLVVEERHQEPLPAPTSVVFAQGAPLAAPEPAALAAGADAPDYAPPPALGAPRRLESDSEFPPEADL